MVCREELILVGVQLVILVLCLKNSLESFLKNLKNKNKTLKGVDVNLYTVGDPSLSSETLKKHNLKRYFR